MSKHSLRRPVGQSINTYWKKKAFKRLGGFLCQCCEEPRKQFLTVDHIQGGGIKHRKLFKGGHAAFYKWIATTPEDVAPLLQILCMNCNWGRRNGNDCPHTKNTPREYSREAAALLEDQILMLEAQRDKLKAEVERAQAAVERIKPLIREIPPGYSYVRQIAPFSCEDFGPSAPSKNQEDRAISLQV